MTLPSFIQDGVILKAVVLWPIMFVFARVKAPGFWLLCFNETRKCLLVDRYDPYICHKKRWSNSHAYYLNSLQPSDAIHRRRSWSTVVQAMAYCPQATRHDLSRRCQSSKCKRKLHICSHIYPETIELIRQVHKQNKPVCLIYELYMQFYPEITMETINQLQEPT